jgi:hypothetical protein
MIEGPDNDACGFLGMATDFHRTQVLRFGFRGSLIERLNDLPYSPDHHGARYSFRQMHDGKPSPIVVEAATTVLLSHDQRVHNLDASGREFIRTAPLC